MTNKRRFKKGDLVRFINTGRHPGRCLGLVEGSLMYVQEVEDNNFEILVKDRDNAWRRLPFYEFELVEETEHEVFVRYTRDEAIILFNYQPVLRIPTRYKLGDQEVDMCCEVEDWANQIVEDLNEHVILPDINKPKTKMKAGPGKVKTRFKCGDIVRRVDTGRCGTCGDSIPTGSILRVMSDEDVAGVVRVHYPQADSEDEEIQDVMWYEIEPVPTEAKVEVTSDIVRVKLDTYVVAGITNEIPTPLGTLHFKQWGEEIAQSMANIINLQISLGKLTPDGIKVEKTNDKERQDKGNTEVGGNFTRRYPW